MSGVKPAERRRHFVTWGLVVLGSTAILTSPLPLRVNGVWAEQNAGAAGRNATGETDGTAEKPSSSYRIQVFKQAADKLKLKGLVACAEDHKVLLGLIKASFPSADVSDRIKITDAPKTETPKPDMKLGSVSFALKALSYLQAGSARIDEQSVALAGDAENRAIYTEVKDLIDSGRPTGVLVEEHITKPASFSWSAELGEGRVRLAGVVPDTDGKKELKDTVQRLFAGLEIVDNTYVSEGVPGSWRDAAMHSLQVLHLLNSGAVVVADHSIHLNGRASDEVTLKKIDQLADKYPAGFALESKVSVPPARATMFGLGFPHSAAIHHYPTVEGAVTDR